MNPMMTTPWPEGRVAIIGSPRAGKTTLAMRMSTKFALRVVHSDSLIALGWSRASDEVARLIEAGPGIYEGVTVVRALRKLLVRHPEVKPVDLVVVLHTPRLELTPGQACMQAGCETILDEIEPELIARKVSMEHIW